MKTITLITAAIGVTLLLNGCTDSPEIMKKGTFDINQRHIVEYTKDTKDEEVRYYYRPDHSWSYKLDANNAYINTVSSSHILACKENDIWFISMNERAEQGEIRYRYLISLAKSQLDDMKDDPTYIPRHDSDEFKALTEIDTKLAREGLIGCVSQMSKEEADKVVPTAKKM